MIKFWQNESWVGRIVWGFLAICAVLLLFGIIAPSDYGHGARP